MTRTAAASIGALPGIFEFLKRDVAAGRRGRLIAFAIYAAIVVLAAVLYYMR